MIRGKQVGVSDRLKEFQGIQRVARGKSGFLLTRIDKSVFGGYSSLGGCASKTSAIGGAGGGAAGGAEGKSTFCRAATEAPSSGKLFLEGSLHTNRGNVVVEIVAVFGVKHDGIVGVTRKHGVFESLRF